MTRANYKDADTDDRAVEALLQQAPPRPMPTELAAARARREVEAEWQRMLGKRRSTRRITLLAAAASVAFAAIVSFNTWMPLGPEPVKVANVARANGTIFVIGDKAEMLEAPGLSAVVTGQTVRTDAGASIGFSWLLGGSLRLDENTEVTFIADDRIELAAGRIYFDSMNTPDSLSVTTAYGDVQHVGTRYMLRNDGRALTVSVRDGRVDIETTQAILSAHAGEQLRFDNSRQRPQPLNVSIFGPEWEWIEAAAPAPDFRGRPIYELLQWVSAETGLRFDFEDEATETLVRTVTVEGDTSHSPRSALRQALLIANLHSNIDEIAGTKSGVVRIRQ